MKVCCREAIFGTTQGLDAQLLSRTCCTGVMLTYWALSSSPLYRAHQDGKVKTGRQDSALCLSDELGADTDANGEDIHRSESG